MQRLTILLLLICTGHLLRAEGDAYLSSMPKVEKIKDDIKGDSELDTKARQSAAYSILSDVITTIVARTRNWTFSDKERQYNAQYNSAASQLIISAYDELDPTKTERTRESSPAAEWKKKQQAYMDDPNFSYAIVSKYVPTETASIYLKLKNIREKEIEAYKSSDTYKQILNDQAEKENATESVNVKNQVLQQDQKWKTIYEPLGLGLSFILFVVVVPLLTVRRQTYVYKDRMLTTRSEYKLYRLTGTVVNASKLTTTHIYSSGGHYDSSSNTYSAPTTSSTTIIHDQIFLMDSQGREHSLRLAGWDIASRESHLLTALWLIKKGNETGDYIAMYNHTTNEEYTKYSRLRRFFWPFRIWVYPLLIVLMLVTPFVFFRFAHKMGIHELIIQHSIGNMYLWTWGFLLFGVLVAASLAHKRALKEAQRFMNEIRLEYFTTKA